MGGGNVRRLTDVEYTIPVTTQPIVKFRRVNQIKIKFETMNEYLILFYIHLNYLFLIFVNNSG